MKTLSSFDGLVDSKGDYAEANLIFLKLFIMIPWIDVTVIMKFLGYYVMSKMSKIIFLALPLVLHNIRITPKLNVISK